VPEEFSRTTARKRIKLPPDNTHFVDVPVITKISFIDASDRYQELQYSIDNSAAADRTVHVDQVPSSVDGHITSADGKGLPVERIEKWPHVDAVDRGQETNPEWDNVTGCDSIPPSFTSHFKTHVVRYKNPNDTSVWIESELIDEIVVLDPTERGQETHYTLNNPQNDDDAQANPDDPEISDTDNGIDPAWRTDPFQNIVNFHNPESLTVRWKFALAITIAGTGTGGACSPVIFFTPSDAVILGGWDHLLTFTLSGGEVPTGFAVSGAPTLTPMTSTLPDNAFGNSYPFPVASAGPSTAFHIHSFTIQGSGPGCYGEGPTSGIHGEGYFSIAGGSVDAVSMSGTINASGISLTFNGNPWVVDSIAINGGQTAAGTGNDFYFVAVSFKPA
jgi:hypothetical protein